MYGRTLAVVVLAVMLLTGCTQSPSYGPEGRATAMTVAVVDPLSPSSVPQWLAGTIEQPVPLASSPGNTSLPWVLVSASPGQATLRVVYIAGGGCTTFIGFVVAETESSVTLSASADTDLTAKVCAADLRAGSGTLTLTAPLGSRTLWHAPVNESWSGSTSVFGTS